MSEMSYSAPQVEITPDDKLWALLSWLLTPLVPIIVLIMEDKKARPFIKYNAMQALFYGIVGYVVASVLSAVLIGCIIGVGLFIYQIVLALQANQGKWVEVPFLTNFCKNQGWI